MSKLHSNVTTLKGAAQSEDLPIIHEVSLPLTGLSVADGHIYYRMFGKAKLVGVFYCLTNLGTTSGATTIMVHNGTAAADMLTGALSIAYDATTPHLDSEAIVAAQANVANNDLLQIDVDAVPGGGTPEGYVVLRFAGQD